MNENAKKKVFGNLEIIYTIFIIFTIAQAYFTSAIIIIAVATGSKVFR